MTRKKKEGFGSENKEDHSKSTGWVNEAGDSIVFVSVLLMGSASIKTCGIGGTSLVVQWLRLHAANTGGLGSIIGQGTRSHMTKLRIHILQLGVRMLQRRPGAANIF